MLREYKIYSMMDKSGECDVVGAGCQLPNIMGLEFALYGFKTSCSTCLFRCPRSSNECPPDTGDSLSWGPPVEHAILCPWGRLPFCLCWPYELARGVSTPAALLLSDSQPGPGWLPSQNWPSCMDMAWMPQVVGSSWHNMASNMCFFVIWKCYCYPMHTYNLKLKAVVNSCW